MDGLLGLLGLLDWNNAGTNDIAIEVAFSETTPGVAPAYSTTLRTDRGTQVVPHPPVLWPSAIRHVPLSPFGAHGQMVKMPVGFTFARTAVQAEADAYLLVDIRKVRRAVG